jgi:hypothetical protein
MFPGTKRWFGLAVESSVAWPDCSTTVVFEGRELLLRPFDEEHSASVQVDLDDQLSWDEAHALLRRYLSALAWTEGFFIRELFQLGGGGGQGSSPFGVALRSRWRTPHFVDRVRPLPTDPRAHLAVALYREALGVTSVAYQVLGFFKIINIVYSTSSAQKAWIKRTIPTLPGPSVNTRVQELQSAGHDVPAYLYESCRCAVAHANASPVANPDLIEDDTRLQADLPVVRALAEHLMTNEIGLVR